jgi:tRNA dimethylallyltransferase
MKFPSQVKYMKVIQRLIFFSHYMFTVRSFCQAFYLPLLNQSRKGCQYKLGRPFLSSSSSSSSMDVVQMIDGTRHTPIVVVIAGPTATGKSDVAAQLCASKKGMIISADSVQAYRGVQIGANKPSLAEQEETPHILISIADHNENYNAAAWREDAILSIQMLLNPSQGMEQIGQQQYATGNDPSVVVGAATAGSDNMTVPSSRNGPRRIEIERTIQNGRLRKGYELDRPLLPVVCGGTMMYLQWLVHGQPDAMRPTPSAVKESYDAIQKFQDDKGKSFQDAVNYVSSFGPVFADRIKKFSGEDWYRLRRTLEVALTVQQTTQQEGTGNDATATTNGKTDYNPPQENDAVHKLAEQLYTGQRQGSLASLGYDVRCFFLCPDDRMGHASVIDERCEQMIVRGLIQETADLSLSGTLPEMAERAIGYRQTLDYLRHCLSEKDDGTMESEDDAFDFYLRSFTTATRQYAKTQMSWFRKDKDFMFIPIPLGMTKTDRVDSAVRAIESLCQLSRSEYEHELHRNDDSASSRCKKMNAEQGKKMKFYQFERHILKLGSNEVKTALQQAVTLRECFNPKKRRLDQIDDGTAPSLSTESCLRIETSQGPAWVIDNALTDDVLQWLDEFRQSLPLDSKRPTVDRRFFSDSDQAAAHFTATVSSSSIPTFHTINIKLERPISSLLEDALHRCIPNLEQKQLLPKPATAGTDQQGPVSYFHVLCYQRFLEYTKENSGLPPHSDGSKICDETKQRSTHTLLLYLTDCSRGGETELLRKVVNNNPDTRMADGQHMQEDEDGNLIYGTQPRRGRILLFPHAAPHAGAAVVSVPKICLRTEVAVSLDLSQK